MLLPMTARGDRALRRRTSVERLVPRALHVVRSGTSLLISRAAAISRSRRARGSCIPVPRARLLFSDLLEEFAASDLSLQLAIFAFTLRVPSRQLSFGFPRFGAFTQRIGVEIAALAFAPPA